MRSHNIDWQVQTSGRHDRQVACYRLALAAQGNLLEIAVDLSSVAIAASL